MPRTILATALTLIVALVLGVEHASPAAAADEDRVDAFNLAVSPSQEVTLGSGAVTFEPIGRTCYEWQEEGGGWTVGNGLISLVGWRNREPTSENWDVRIDIPTLENNHWTIDWTPKQPGNYVFVAACFLQEDPANNWYQSTFTDVLVRPAGEPAGAATTSMKGKAKKFVKTGAAVNCDTAILKGKFKKKQRVNKVSKAVFKAVTADGMSKTLKKFKASKIKPGKRFKLKNLPAATQKVKVTLKLKGGGKVKGYRKYQPCT